MDVLLLFGIVTAAAFLAAVAVGRAWVLGAVAGLAVIALTVGLVIHAREDQPQDWSDGMLFALGLGMTAIAMGAAIVGLLLRGWPQERPDDEERPLPGDV